MKRFEIDVSQIKIAAGEESISHTIEELLSMNDLIPAHTDEEVGKITEKQLDDSDYNNKPSRGEVEGITEIQLDLDNPGESRIQEVQIQEAKETDGGHRPEMWDKDDVESRGHKNVAPIWLQIYKQEDDRKESPMKNKLKEAAFSLSDNEPKTFEYFINLYERGEFFADVRDPAGDSVLTINGFQIFEDGFMRDVSVLRGLKEHLVSMGIMGQHDELVMGNSVKNTWS